MFGLVGFGIVFITAALLALVARAFKQPLIPAYIVAGLLLGPVFGFIKDPQTIAAISEMGIAFLLFIVGLEINLEKLKDVGKFVVYGTLIQVGMTAGIMYFFGTLLGYSMVASLYLGVIVAFSSTMVVIKLLADYGEMDTLHARIIIGFMLMQDLVALVALSTLSSVGSFSIATILWSLLKDAFVIMVALLIGKYALPSLFRFAAKSQELLFVAAIAVCFLFSIMFTSMASIAVLIERFLHVSIPVFVVDFLTPGLSFTIGAFFAGVVLGNLPYNFGIISKVSTVKDFFSIIFFVSLGMQLVAVNVREIALPVLLLLFAVAVVKPLIVFLVCLFAGFKRRTSLMAALYMGQVSEFSLIIAFQALSAGQIDQNLLTVIIIATILSIAITSYLFKYAEAINRKLSFLRVLDRFAKVDRDSAQAAKMHYNVVLCGHDRIGYSILKSAARLNLSTLVIDYNPETIKHMIRQNIPCIYGDINDEEMIKELHLDQSSIIVSTVPNVQANLLLLHHAKRNPATKVFTTASQVREALQLYEAGADYVILPHFLGGEHVSLLLERIAGDQDALGKIRDTHISELHHRRTLGHEHPTTY